MDSGPLSKVPNIYQVEGDKKLLCFMLYNSQIAISIPSRLSKIYKEPPLQCTNKVFSILTNLNQISKSSSMSNITTYLVQKMRSGALPWETKGKINIAIDISTLFLTLAHPAMQKPFRILHRYETAVRRMTHPGYYLK